MCPNCSNAQLFCIDAANLQRVATTRGPRSLYCRGPLPTIIPTKYTHSRSLSDANFPKIVSWTWDIHLINVLVIIVDTFCQRDGQFSIFDYAERFFLMACFRIWNRKLVFTNHVVFSRSKLKIGQLYAIFFLAFPAFETYLVFPQIYRQ